MAEEDYEEGWDGAGTETLGEEGIGARRIQFDLPPMITMNGMNQMMMVPGGRLEIHTRVQFVPDVPAGPQKPVQCVRCGAQGLTKFVMDHEGAYHEDTDLCRLLTKQSD